MAILEAYTNCKKERCKSESTLSETHINERPSNGPN